MLRRTPFSLTSLLISCPISLDTSLNLTSLFHCPETKVLKQLVRNIIDPSRDLGHVDGKKKIPTATPTVANESRDTSIVETALAAPTSLADFIAQTDTAGGQQDAAKLGEKGGSKEVERGDREVVRDADGSICEDCW